MMGHVAEAGEGQGRVVVWLPPGPRLSPQAIAVTLDLAASFGAEVEALYCEDRVIAAATALPIASRRALDGGALLPAQRTSAAAAAEADAAFFLMRDALVAAASRRAILATARRQTGDPAELIARACAEEGPWNVVVDAEPLSRATAGRLGDLLDAVWDATGFVLVPGSARGTLAPRHLLSRFGPVLVAVEDGERLMAQCRTARRLAARTRRSVVVLVLADDEGAVATLAREASRQLAGEPSLTVEAAPPCRGEPEVAVAAIARRAPSLLIARYGGRAVPAGDLSALAAAMHGAVLVVR
ncbi:MAG: hypothetical protein NW205_01060 [Hyphomicrobiaceae bacterium]|nr:hypothetical protein [Hyphomicrobiaceae bacterium]